MTYQRKYITTVPVFCMPPRTQLNNSHSQSSMSKFHSMVNSINVQINVHKLYNPLYGKFQIQSADDTLYILHESPSILQTLERSCFKSEVSAGLSSLLTSLTSTLTITNDDDVPALCLPNSYIDFYTPESSILQSS